MDREQPTKFTPLHFNGVVRSQQLEFDVHSFSSMFGQYRKLCQKCQFCAGQELWVVGKITKSPKAEPGCFSPFG